MITTQSTFKEESIYRLGCILALVFNPILGVLGKIEFPSGIDPWNYRLAVTAGAPIILLLSFFSPWVKKHIAITFVCYLGIWWIWLVYLVGVNNFSLLYVINLYVFMAGSMIMLNKLSWLIGYSCFLFFCLLVGTLILGFSHLDFLFQIAAVCSVYLISVGWRIVTQDKLQQSQQKLQEQGKMLQQKSQELQERNEELQKINKLMVGREITMIELKKELQKYKTAQGAGGS